MSTSVLTSDCTDWVVYDMPRPRHVHRAADRAARRVHVRPNRLDTGDTLSAWYEIAVESRALGDVIDVAGSR